VLAMMKNNGNILLPFPVPK